MRYVWAVLAIPVLILVALHPSGQRWLASVARKEIERGLGN